MDQWYYTHAGKQTGPVSVEQLKQLIVSGHLRSTDEVWKQGTPDWISIRFVPVLADLLQTIPLLPADSEHVSLTTGPPRQATSEIEMSKRCGRPEDDARDNWGLNNTAELLVAVQALIERDGMRAVEQDLISQGVASELATAIVRAATRSKRRLAIRRAINNRIAAAMVFLGGMALLAFGIGTGWLFGHVIWPGSRVIAVGVIFTGVLLALIGLFGIITGILPMRFLDRLFR